MVQQPSLGKTSEDFRFIFSDREAIGKNKQKIRSHLGPVVQVSGRLCEAKQEAKSPWSDIHDKNVLKIDGRENHLIDLHDNFWGFRAI